MTSRTPVPRKSTGGRGPGRSRFEHDALGIREIPADVYWGIRTLRALEDFPMASSELSSHRSLVTALAQIRRASALANLDLGRTDEATTTAIVQACREIEQGRLLDQFVVDVLNGGAAAFTNANANEVIANRALEILGHDRGTYSVIHPDDLNSGQSVQEAYATAIRLAAIQSSDGLLSAMAELREGAATPALELDEHRIRDALDPLHVVAPPMTGAGCSPDAPDRAAAFHGHLRRITGRPLTPAAGPEERSSGSDALVLLSGALTHAAAGLSTTFAGRVEPTLAATVDHVAFDLMGHDLTIRLAAEAGRPTAFEPVIAQALSRSLSRLTSVCTVLAEQTLSPALETLPLLTRS